MATTNSVKSLEDDLRRELLQLQAVVTGGAWRSREDKGLAPSCAVDIPLSESAYTRARETQLGRLRPPAPFIKPHPPQTLLNHPADPTHIGPRFFFLLLFELVGLLALCDASSHSSVYV